ncbi:MAG TPA: VOC family protein, partial [Xanthomonadales bacterium]|nr:VOC family protein [Xanthomonadales bacterium]
MQKITPSLWFDKNCEEAINFYISVFPNSKITHIQYYPEGSTEPHMQGMEGKVLTGIFELAGQRFMALDGGPIFKLNPSISFILNFDPSKRENAKEELTVLWKKLSEGGIARMPLQKYDFSELYGWTEDKYGVSWQLMLTDPSGEDRPFITPSLMFTQERAGKAEEAVDFYLSVFKNSKKGMVARYPAGMEHDKEGSIMFSDFMLENQWFAAMDSAQVHDFKFNEAVSLYVECEDQNEIDELWNKLTTAPEFEQCGWLKDKYGLSWQIIPKQLGELLSDPYKEKAGRVLQAMLQMKKIDIAGLQKAYDR